MKILRTDDTDSTDRVAARLRAEGHLVLEDCLPDRTDPSGCRGLRGDRCPLRLEPDLALVGEDDRGTEHRPSAGVVCAHRSAIPVVTVGRLDAEHADLGGALARRAARGDELVARRVEDELRSLLEDLGLGEGSVHVHRRGGEDRIVAELPAEVTERDRHRIAVRLLGAATATGRCGPRRSVVIRRRPAAGA